MLIALWNSGGGLLLFNLKSSNRLLFRKFIRTEILGSGANPNRRYCISQRDYHGSPQNPHSDGSNDTPSDKAIGQLTIQQLQKCGSQLKEYLYKAEDWLLKDVSLEDPEIFMDFDQLITSNGYFIEPHLIETEDGYILSLFRVKKKSDKPSLQDDKPKKDSRKPAVLLVHGFQCAAVSWFLNSPHKTLPYALVDAGYDCWVANLRGTPQSKNHTKLCRDSRQFWDFSFHEMGRFDVPQMINFILEQRGDSSLHYIGHSMGCSVFFVAMSLRPELIRKVKTMIALGPAVYGSHVRSKPLKWGAAPLANFFAKIKYLHQQEIFGRPFRSISSFFCPPLRSPERLGGYIGRKYGLFFGGLGLNQIESSRIAKIAGHWPQSTSLKAMCHGMQCIQSKRFQNYDYGEVENLERYGQIGSPLYDLSKINCPVATFYAIDDELCTTDDVTNLAKDLPNLICNVGITEPNFTHGDFIFGKDAYRLVYDPLIKIFSKYD